MESDSARKLLDRLRAGAATCSCGGYLAAQNPLQRSEICTSLLFDRLGRKMRTVEALRREADENWNQTFYLLYFRTLGDRQNQQAFLELARRVPYKTVLRERLVPHAVEALLLGTSGLLDLYPHDTYTLDLKRAFVYLAAKYEITAMEAGAWQLANIRPANHPVLRIAQAAEFFSQDEFIMERAMACRSEEDIRQLFCVEASPYWPHAPHAGCRARRIPQTHRPLQGQHHRHQPRLRAAVRLRQQHGPRGAARQRPLAARTPARRGEPLHAPVGRGGRRTPQRLRVAGPAAARHGVLRGGTLRGVSRRAAHFAENRRRKDISGPSSCVFTGKSLLL